MGAKEITTWSELQELMTDADLTATDVLFIIAKHCSDNISIRLKHNCNASANVWLSRFNTLNNYIVNEAMSSLSIQQQMEEIVEDMCSKYCKWPDLWDEEAEGIELCESDICANCPLNRLV